MRSLLRRDFGPGETSARKCFSHRMHLTPNKLVGTYRQVRTSNQQMVSAAHATPDANLLSAAVRGDEAAFDTLVGPLIEAGFKLAVVIIRDREERAMWSRKPPTWLGGDSTNSARKTGYGRGFSPSWPTTAAPCAEGAGGRPSDCHWFEISRRFGSVTSSPISTYSGSFVDCRTWNVSPYSCSFTWTCL